MSRADFVPALWSEKIQRDLEKALVFGEGCTREYEGMIKNQGDTVNITKAGSPTIRTLTVANAAGSITAAEQIFGTKQQLVIDQFNYFNFEVADVDRAQALNGLFDALTKNAAYGLANAVDEYIAGLVAGATDVNNTAVAITSSNALTQLDSGIEKLFTNNVPKNSEFEVIIPPAYYTCLKQAYVGLATDNVSELGNGRVGKYGNIVIKMSNNVYKDSNDVYHCPVYVRGAIALAMQLSKTEAYRPEGKFSDALKGFNLYGAKIVDSAEIVDLNVTL